MSRYRVDPAETASAAALAASALGVVFGDPTLAVTALSVPDWASTRGVESYQRLELLGDAVVGLLAVEHVYRDHPELPEGVISRVKSEIVSGASLAAAADRVGLGDAILSDQPIGEPGSRRRESVLSDVFEAVVGAIYLDQGIEAAREAVDRLLLTDAVPMALSGAHRDPKGMLQELRAEDGHTPPEYRVVASDGPAHDPTFRVEVVLDGQVAGRGSGPSKKAAEQVAAAEALKRGPRPSD